jgi:hypothetical protein
MVMVLMCYSDLARSDQIMEKCEFTMMVALPDHRRPGLGMKSGELMYPLRPQLSALQSIEVQK